jgi:protein-tyrosine kinase
MSIIEKAAQRIAAQAKPMNGGSSGGPGISAEALHGLQPVRTVVPDLTAEARGPSECDAELRLRDLGLDLMMSPEGGRSRTAEEFRMIKRPLLVNVFDRGSGHQTRPNLIMVTSSVQGEGKTFTSLNLAVSITMELDSTVLLVDADVARPGLSRVLHLSERAGLLDRLADERTDLANYLLRTDIAKLTVLPAGTKHNRSTELLASGTMRRLLDELAWRYSDRIVLFDSPPLLETSEASVLASQMGQVVIVVESDSTSQSHVQEALALLSTTDNAYLVLNKCKDTIFTGKYAYGYGYGSYGEQ